MCDGADLAGLTCENQGYEGGMPGCLDCVFDPSDCHNCGNGVIDADEACDGQEFGGVTCQSLGCDDGNLTCISLVFVSSASPQKSHTVARPVEFKRT